MKTNQDIINILLDNKNAVPRAIKVIHETGKWNNDHTEYGTYLYDWVITKNKALSGQHKDKAFRLVLRYVTYLTTYANLEEIRKATEPR